MSQDAEYESLRREILGDKDREFNIINFGSTATAGLIGLGFTTGQSLIFLTPLVVLTMALIQVKNVLYSSLTKAVHIRVVIESRTPDLNWEQCINRHRENVRNRRGPGYLLFEVSPYMAVTMVLGGICVLMACYFSIFPLKKIERIASLGMIEQIASFVFGFLWIYFSIHIGRRIRHATSGKYEKELEGEWKKIWISCVAEEKNISTRGSVSN
jgi:hypothetical protein